MRRLAAAGQGGRDALPHALLRVTSFVNASRWKPPSTEEALAALIAAAAPAAVVLRLGFVSLRAPRRHFRTHGLGCILVVLIASTASAIHTPTLASDPAAITGKARQNESAPAGKAAIKTPTLPDTASPRPAPRPPAEQRDSPEDAGRHGASLEARSAEVHRLGSQVTEKQRRDFVQDVLTQLRANASQLGDLVTALRDQATVARTDVQQADLGAELVVDMTNRIKELSAKMGGNAKQMEEMSKSLHDENLRQKAVELQRFVEPFGEQADAVRSLALSRGPDAPKRCPPPEDSPRFRTFCDWGFGGRTAFAYDPVSCGSGAGVGRDAETDAKRQCGGPHCAIYALGGAHCRTNVGDWQNSEIEEAEETDEVDGINASSVDNANNSVREDNREAVADTEAGHAALREANANIDEAFSDTKSIVNGTARASNSIIIKQAGLHSRGGTLGNAPTVVDSVPRVFNIAAPVVASLSGNFRPLVTPRGSPKLSPHLASSHSSPPLAFSWKTSAAKKTAAAGSTSASEAHSASPSSTSPKPVPSNAIVRTMQAARNLSLQEAETANRSKAIAKEAERILEFQEKEGGKNTKRMIGHEKGNALPDRVRGAEAPRRKRMPEGKPKLPRQTQRGETGEVRLNAKSAHVSGGRIEAQTVAAMQGGGKEGEESHEELRVLAALHSAGAAMRYAKQLGSRTLMREAREVMAKARLAYLNSVKANPVTKQAVASAKAVTPHEASREREQADLKANIRKAIRRRDRARAALESARTSLDLATKAGAKDLAAKATFVVRTAAGSLRKAKLFLESLVGKSQKKHS
eukprot:TRINITY_DN50779_c0_g1_i1.p1 TRINITY_DN50779_c0_g1~~TRINITY_DN50779_c0_g1_i1.p1  ORF type:complete len:808 (-),score=143.15 TRINITY_DN50779_c0_g1_i1:59-2482(-)